MQEVTFLQKKYICGMVITTEFKDGDEFIFPNFIVAYRFITRKVVGKTEFGYPIYSEVDNSIPWILNPNA